LNAFHRPQIARRRAEEERADTLFRLRATTKKAGRSASCPERSEEKTLSEPLVWLTIFVLSVFVGIEVISKVSSTLHTPLMSGANAIHGVILVGAVLVTGAADSTPVLVLGLAAVVLASINMVGGFVVTDRMLVMFSGRKKRVDRPKPPELEP
jgi:NAD(P) transhydrogenase subunit alpha